MNGSSRIALWGISLATALTVSLIGPTAIAAGPGGAPPAASAGKSDAAAPATTTRALFDAIGRRDVDRVRALLEQGADPNATLEETAPRTDMSLPRRITPLMQAALLGDSECARLLLDHGASPGAVDENGGTALHWAVIGYGFAQMAGRTAPKDLVELLIQHGADVNAGDSHGVTPLMLAAKQLSLGAATVLLTQGARVNQRDASGRTALLHAVSNEPRLTPDAARTRLRLVKLLLDHGADQALGVNHGLTPLLLASASDDPDLVRLLRTGELPPAPKRRLAAPPRSLLAIAKAVATGFSLGRMYRWRSGTELLVLRYQPRPDGAVEPVWFRRDLRTGRETKVPLPEPLPNPEIAISPDGRWVLLSPSEGAHAAWQTAALEGVPSRHRSAVPAALLERYQIAGVYQRTWGWMPDSRQWLWLIATHERRDLRALVFGRDRPGLLREIAVRVPAAPEDVSAQAPTALLGFLPNGDVLTVTGAAAMQPGDRVTVYAFAVTGASTSARHWSISLPVRATADPVLSPGGDRLLWVLAGVPGSGASPEPSGDTVELWISRTDGSGMRGLGTLAVPPGPFGFDTGSVQWMPDGKRVSFVYHGSLFALAVGG